MTKEDLEALKAEYNKHHPRASILVYVSDSFNPKRLKYLYRKWESFEYFSSKGFEEIDPRWSIDIGIWIDDD